MTTFDATVPAAQIGAVAPAGGFVRFRGEPRPFWRLLAHGAVLLMFTLGIYRFWLTTDIRRFLWSNTELAGESFEYTGTARELLLGFLIAIAILLPLYAGFFLVALRLGELSSLLALLVLTVLGHYAVYRARRYRLTRTVYRGVRFHQSGSAWRYAICAVLWWTLILSTLGLVYPFAQSRLERFKMRNTFFGNLQGRFEGSGARLFLRGCILWLIAVVPFGIGLVATVRAVDWSALADAAGGDDLSSWLEASGLAGAMVYAGLTGIWVLLAFVLLYPVFQAIVLHWWTSGLRFGEVAVTSRLRTAQVLGVYARFLLCAFLFSLAAAAVVIPGAIVIPKLTGELDSMPKEIVTTFAGVAAYVAIALGYSAIYQATVKLGLWRCVVESLDISNPAVLEQVTAAGQPASPVGEGLADALSVGGVRARHDHFGIRHLLRRSDQRPACRSGGTRPRGVANSLRRRNPSRRVALRRPRIRTLARGCASPRPCRQPGARTARDSRPGVRRRDRQPIDPGGSQRPQRATHADQGDRLEPDRDRVPRRGCGLGRAAHRHPARAAYSLFPGAQAG